MNLQMKKNLMVLVAVLFAIPSAHAQLPVYKDALDLANMQLEIISSDYEGGLITEEIAHNLVSHTKFTFESAVHNESETKSLNTIENGSDQRNLQNIESIKIKFNKFENYEIPISELSDGINGILDTDGIERPGNTHFNQEQRK